MGGGYERGSLVSPVGVDGRDLEGDFGICRSVCMRSFRFLGKCNIPEDLLR